MILNQLFYYNDISKTIYSNFDLFRNSSKKNILYEHENNIIFIVMIQCQFRSLHHPVKDVTWKNIERDYLKKEKWMSSNPFECRSSTSVTRNKFLDTTTSCIELAFYMIRGFCFQKLDFLAKILNKLKI